MSEGTCRVVRPLLAIVAGLLVAPCASSASEPVRIFEAGIRAAPLKEHVAASDMAASVAAPLQLMADGEKAILVQHGLPPVLATPGRAGPAQKPPVQEPPAGTLAIGEASPVLMSTDQLAALPRKEIAVKQVGKAGERVTSWSGPLLWDVLKAAGAIDPAKHGDHPHLVIHATGKDGYVAAIALAELSPEFENKSIIIADQMNGVALPDHALRLVVPEDKRAGRAVRDLVRVTVGP